MALVSDVELSSSTPEHRDSSPSTPGTLRDALVSVSRRQLPPNPGLAVGDGSFSMLLDLMDRSVSWGGLRVIYLR